jgi:hypothetical protein
LKGQRRIHFVRESDARRRFILSRLQDLGTRVCLYHVDGLQTQASRTLCLQAIVHDAAEMGVTRVVLETDETVARFDLRTMQSATFRAGLTGTLGYGHAPASSEPLLWAADAIAWSYSKGGNWLRRISAMVITTRLLLP